MERRVRRLEVASRSALLCQLATEVAEVAGLDPGLSLPEIAAQEGIDLVELEAMLMRPDEHKLA
jgi:hypothetical protein